MVRSSILFLIFFILNNVLIVKIFFINTHWAIISIGGIMPKIVNYFLVLVSIGKLKILFRFLFGFTQFKPVFKGPS